MSNQSFEDMADMLARRLNDPNESRLPLNEELRIFARRVASEQIERDAKIASSFAQLLRDASYPDRARNLDEIAAAIRAQD
jgi:hypothetical protein